MLHTGPVKSWAPLPTIACPQPAKAQDRIQPSIGSPQPRPSHTIKAAAYIVWARLPRHSASAPSIDMRPPAHALLLAALATLASGSTCTSYTIIYTRGVTAPQTEFKPVEMMNSQILAKLPGGKLYNTVYPATWDLQTSHGVADIVNKITTTLQSNAGECFFLEGYSLGAAVTTNALPKLSGAAAAAVKGVFMFGNSEHKAGLACNVDPMGGTSTRDVNGEKIADGHIPDDWVSKCLDVCIVGDRICDTTHDRVGDRDPHVFYPSDPDTQNMGAKFAIEKLSAG
ncbi:alpha/beta-hydrolase [Teratosphaeria nubilosa]|uniref:Alpha/beta-hydrolase n=1 Tax=Teratosphaeria nubilosa TaxID=161662 RepID=A0A6G1LGI1_9PEZI|nr:alpha/beta-hydrolase [Teratosphaeria nubilosa]